MRFFSKMLSMLLVCCFVQTANAQCWVEGGQFANQDGGCMDLETGLVWSADSRAVLGRTYGTVSEEEYYTVGYNNLAYGGYEDWRLPTIGEVDVAVANGLNTHLDFFLDGGTTPDDDEYRWVADVIRFRGSHKRGGVRFIDGDVNFAISADRPVILVRGLAPPDDKPGNGNGKGKNAKLSTTAGVPEPSTVALALLALAGPLALRWRRRRGTRG